MSLNVVLRQCHRQQATPASIGLDLYEHLYKSKYRGDSTESFRIEQCKTTRQTVVHVNVHPKLVVTQTVVYNSQN